MVPCYSRYCSCRLYTPRNTSLHGSTSVASIAAGSSASWGTSGPPFSLSFIHPSHPIHISLHGAVCHPIHISLHGAVCHPIHISLHGAVCHPIHISLHGAVCHLCQCNLADPLQLHSSACVHHRCVRSVQFCSEAPLKAWPLARWPH